MDETFPHLTIQRETPVNEKRPGNYVPPKIPRDTRGHARGLLQNLAKAKGQAASDIGGFDDRKLFRFTVQKGFNPDDLRKISPEIEFVSQEEETVVIGFASNAAIDDFEARLSTMIRGDDVTNKQVLYALQSIKGWSSDDRKGWALRKFGFPESEEFLIDVELWPLEDNQQGNEQEWVKFEEWLKKQSIEKKDKVKQPGLILYRLLCNPRKAEQLLRHRDVRSVDLPPSFGLERSVIFQDIQNFPEIIAPSEEAPGIVVLDSGLATGHPLLGAAVGDAQSFLPGEEVP